MVDREAEILQLEDKAIDALKETEASCAGAVNGRDAKLVIFGI